jgi:starch phosphorylase
MMDDYVRQLYAPAAGLARRLEADQGAASGLAAWKRRVREAWPEVRIEHVETSGISDSPALGSQLCVQVYARLGDLTADDVDVQIVHGRVASDDELRDPQVASLAHVGEDEQGGHRFEAELSLDDAGPFGYTVRICPKNDLLAAPADLGLVAWPAEPVPVED